jgi:hypothetical protein
VPTDVGESDSLTLEERELDAAELLGALDGLAWLADKAEPEEKLLRFAARQQIGSELVEYEAVLRAARRYGVDCSRWLSPAVVVNRIAAGMDECDSAWQHGEDDLKSRIEAYGELVLDARELLTAETARVRPAVDLAASRCKRAPFQPGRLVLHRRGAGRPRSRERRAAGATRARAPDDPDSDPDAEPLEPDLATAEAPA